MPASPKARTASPNAPARNLKARARKIDALLAGAYPDAVCELDFANPLQCLVSTILSAQTTDKAVNKVTPALFRAFPDAAAFAAAAPEDIEPYIRTLGLFRNKAKNIASAARVICTRHGGRVPDTIDELVLLPGVGRKTANCVVLNAYAKPGIMADTHFCRLTRRWGLHDLDDPEKIEFAVGALLPPGKWGDFSHRTILHGRARCHARKPDCGECELSGVCRWSGPAR